MSGYARIDEANRKGKRNREREGEREREGRSPMETCARGSLLASFPRDFPRENEKGLRVRDWSETSALGWKVSIPSVGSRRKRERERGFWWKKSKKLGRELLKSKSTRERCRITSEKGEETEGEKGEKKGRRGPYK